MLGTCIYRGEYVSILDVLETRRGTELLIYWGTAVWVPLTEVSLVRWVGAVSG